MDLHKIAAALRTIADALAAEVQDTPAPTQVDPPEDAPGPAPTQANPPEDAPGPAPTQTAPTETTAVVVMDAQVFTTQMQTMAREVGSGVLHQMMPDVYNRYAGGVQKYSAIKPENRGAVLQYIRDRIDAAKQGGG